MKDYEKFLKEFNWIFEKYRKLVDAEGKTFTASSRRCGRHLAQSMMVNTFLL